MKDFATFLPSSRLLRCVSLSALATCSMAIAGAAQQTVEAVASDVGTVVVHGRAVDGEGVPLAGCAVGVFERGTGVDVAALLTTPAAITDSDGRYRLQVASREPYRWMVATTRTGMQVCVQRLNLGGADRHEMPLALLLPGATLAGRIRDANGAALAGASVKVTDPAVEGRGVTTWFESLATSDERGIFQVRGVPRTGLSVTVQAEGYAPQQLFAAQDSPLDVRLEPTGLVRGRVVDASGRPVADAAVRFAVVGRHPRTPHVRSAADGSFVMTAPDAWRFRVTASSPAPPFTQYTSGLLRGPADDVVVRARTAELGGEALTVRCVEAETGEPVASFEAWHTSIDSRTPALLLLHQPDPVHRYRSEAVFHVVRGPGNRTLGSVVARAEGYGFAIVPVPEEIGPPLVCELPPECVLVGTVTDVATGQPMAGAAVVAMPFANLSGSCDPSRVGVETDAQGRYRVRGLTAGHYGVFVFAEDRPDARVRSVHLKPGEPAELDLTVEAAAWTEITLRGHVPERSTATVEWRGIQSRLAGEMSLSSPGRTMMRSVLLAGRESFRIPRPRADSHALAVLRMPGRDRLGSAVEINLGQISGETWTLAVPDLTRALCSGRVQLPSQVPTARIAVVATRTGGGKARTFGARAEPTIVGIASDGRFTIDLTAGTYALQLADFETGIVFHTEADDIVVGTDGTPPRIALRPVVRWLDLRFEPQREGDPVMLQGISIERLRHREGTLPALLRRGSRHNDRQTSWWSPPAGSRAARWLVPAGHLKLIAHQTFDQLSPTTEGWQTEVVGEHEVDIDKPEQVVTFSVPPPPSDDELVRGSR